MPPTRSYSNNKLSKQAFIRMFALCVILGFASVVVFSSLHAASQSHHPFQLGQQWKEELDNSFLVSILSSELPIFATSETIKHPGMMVSGVLLSYVTSFNPNQPETLLAQEIPGLSSFETSIFDNKVVQSELHFPQESWWVPVDDILTEREAQVQSSEPRESSSGKPELHTGDKQVVFIYHSHNRESWLPHLPDVTNPNQAFHHEVNITLVGERLAEELEKRGIGAVADTTDITRKLNEAGLPYALSYAKSKEVIEAAISEHEEIVFIFDLHRDAQRRDITTIEIEGETYARTFFVIGSRNSNYQKNKAFAQQFHDALDEAYPGLSRGVLVQPIGHGEYNQSVSEHSLLIEIGGVDNTLEESYRTAEALADVIADLYWDAEKVDIEPAAQSY